MGTTIISGVLSHLIGVIAMTAVLFFLKNKKVTDPKYELYGQPLSTLIPLAYVGIGGFVLLAIVQLTK